MSFLITINSSPEISLITYFFNKVYICNYYNTRNNLTVCAWASYKTSHGCFQGWSKWQRWKCNICVGHNGPGSIHPPLSLRSSVHLCPGFAACMQDAAAAWRPTQLGDVCVWSWAGQDLSKEFTSTLRNRNVNVKKDSSQCEYGSVGNFYLNVSLVNNSQSFPTSRYFKLLSNLFTCPEVFLLCTNITDIPYRHLVFCIAKVTAHIL